jgi:hypothetical protein
MVRLPTESQLQLPARTRRLAQTDRLLKNASLFEFSLRLFRACLGKMITFSIKWRKKTRFLTWGSQIDA